MLSPAKKTLTEKEFLKFKINGKKVKKIIRFNKLD